MGRMSDHRPAAASYAAPNPQPIVKPTITGRVCMARLRALADASSFIPSRARGEPRLTAQQVAETAAAYRANYANCDEELRNLVEARLTAALKADGYAVPCLQRTAFAN